MEEEDRLPPPIRFGTVAICQLRDVPFGDRVVMELGSGIRPGLADEDPHP